MTTITMSHLRSRLTKALRSALSGDLIRIRLKEGNVVLISESAYESLAKSTTVNSISPLSPKIPGKIVGKLENAEDELLKHLTLLSQIG